MSMNYIQPKIKTNNQDITPYHIYMVVLPYTKKLPRSITADEVKNLEVFSFERINKKTRWFNRIKNFLLVISFPILSLFNIRYDKPSNVIEINPFDFIEEQILNTRNGCGRMLPLDSLIEGHRIFPKEYSTRYDIHHLYNTNQMTKKSYKVYKNLIEAQTHLGTSKNTVGFVVTKKPPVCNDTGFENFTVEDGTSFFYNLQDAESFSRSEKKCTPKQKTGRSLKSRIKDFVIANIILAIGAFACTTTNASTSSDTYIPNSYVKVSREENRKKDEVSQSTEENSFKLPENCLTDVKDRDEFIEEDEENSNGKLDYNHNSNTKLRYQRFFENAKQIPQTPSFSISQLVEYEQGKLNNNIPPF